MARTHGFYWVNIGVVGKIPQYWVVAEWTHEQWWEIGGEVPRTDSDFLEIDERRLRRADPDVNPVHFYMGREGVRG